MKFARLIQQYKYDLKTWNGDGNIGDCIQNIAVKNLYEQLGISDSDLVKINRDEIADYSGEPVILPMQGWFGNVHQVFGADWSENIIPVFIGFHLNDFCGCRDEFENRQIAVKMKEFEPIGCRDRNTAEFLQTSELNTYFSGCLTLTFPRREKEPENGKIFLVDLKKEALRIIPEKIKKAADTSITHNYRFNSYPVSYEEAQEFEKKAQEILNRYKTEAKLIITSRIHCAMPCIAMGIPVIFIHKNIQNIRFDVLNGLIPKYSPDNAALINWNPKAPNIEKLKNYIKTNASFQIYSTAKKYSNIELIKIKPENCIKKLEKTFAGYNQKDKILQFILNTQIELGEKNKLFKLYKILNSNKKIIIWGASLFIQDFIKKYRIRNNNVIGIIDKNPEREGSFICGYEIFSPEILDICKPDVVVFAIKNNHNKIYKETKDFLAENHPDIYLYQDLM